MKQLPSHQERALEVLRRQPEILNPQPLRNYPERRPIYISLPTSNQMGWICLFVGILGAIAVGVILAIGVAVSDIKRANHPSSGWCISLICR